MDYYAIEFLYIGIIIRIRVLHYYTTICYTESDKQKQNRLVGYTILYLCRRDVIPVTRMIQYTDGIKYNDRYNVTYNKIK